MPTENHRASRPAGVARRAGVALILAPTLALAAVGCGDARRDELPREAVWGKVSFEGEPLAGGAIRLRTAAPGAGPPLEIGGLIRDGEYSIARAEGPTPGTYLVSITEEAASQLAPGEAPGPFIKKASRLPSIYNAKSTLKVEIKPGQAEAIDFALKKSTEPEPAPSRSTARRR